MPKFTPNVFEISPQAEVFVPEVRIGSQEMVAAYLRIRNRGELLPGSRHTFEVQQLVAGEVVGGSTYNVVIEGDPDHPPLCQFPFIMDDDDPAVWDRIELEEEIDSYLPPWATELVLERREEMGKIK